MKEEEPVDGKKSEDDGIEKENLAILEKIRKNQRQDHLNVSGSSVSSLGFSLISRLPYAASVGPSVSIGATASETLTHHSGGC